MSDRPYQEAWKHGIYNAWGAGYQNVLGVMPTGGGKSHTLGEIVKEHQGWVSIIAHRQELVGQLAMTLAHQGIRHQIVAPRSVVKFNINEQYRELNTSMIAPNADVAVIGVDTIIRRHKEYDSHLKRTTMWATDECHHLLKSNKWGKAVSFMPQALGLGVTATPCRADNQGLGRHAQGVMDFMVEGPTMRDLIHQGYLTDYRIFAPPSDVDYTEVNIGKSGDYVQKQLSKAVRQSHLMGDVVEHYLRIAPGKQGVTFATDVEIATDTAHRFNAAGVPAEVISAKTPDNVRAQVMRAFRTGQLKQIVNVDILGEGVDCPAIEVVSFARRTMSYSLYSQQFGRALRILEGKSEAIIIDHVGNVALHGLPDKERVWSLDGAKPRFKDPHDDIPLRYCAECTQPYVVTLRECPYCGFHPIPADRTSPKVVDGDLHELSPETLAAMRGEVAKVDRDPAAVAQAMVAHGTPHHIAHSAYKKMWQRKEMQLSLRESISWFAHMQDGLGRTQSESYRIFYHLFGVDVLSAQALGRPDALDLADRINQYIGEHYQ